jgi:hypothetical protein
MVEWIKGTSQLPDNFRNADKGFFVDLSINSSDSLVANAVGYTQRRCTEDRNQCGFTNKDSFKRDDNLLRVADGVSLSSGSEDASEIAVSYTYEDPIKFIKEVDGEICSKGAGHTTLASVKVIEDDEGFGLEAVKIGDTKIKIIRDNEVIEVGNRQNIMTAIYHYTHLVQECINHDQSVPEHKVFGPIIDILKEEFQNAKGELFSYTLDTDNHQQLSDRVVIGDIEMALKMLVRSVLDNKTINSEEMSVQDILQSESHLSSYLQDSLSSLIDRINNHPFYFLGDISYLWPDLPDEVLSDLFVYSERLLPGDKVIIYSDGFYPEDHELLSMIQEEAIDSNQRLIEKLAESENVDDRTMVVFDIPYENTT